MGGPLALGRRLGVYALSALPGGDTKRFFIVCPPRTGSELLVSLLASNPAIRCEGEIFKSPPASPLRVAAGRARLAGLRGFKAWGCKILDQQIRWFPERFGEPAEFLDNATKAGWTIVHLARRDVLAQVLSAIHAEQHQHHYRDVDDVAFERITVDVADLVAWLVNLESNARWLADAVRPFDPVELVYEDDLVDPAARQASIDRVYSRIGVPSAPVRTELHAIAPPQAADRVANWDEVVEVLARTRFRDLVTR